MIDSSGVMIKVRQWLGRVTLAMVVSMLPATGFSASGADRSLNDISFSSLSNGSVEIKLLLSGVPLTKAPLAFTTAQPARIAFDLNNTSSFVAKRKMIGLGQAISINAIESKGRTRIVINLSEAVPYQTRIEADGVYVVLGELPSVETVVVKKKMPGKRKQTVNVPVQVKRAIENIDFRRGENGGGHVIVELSDNNTPVDISQNNKNIILTFSSVALPDAFSQRLDVIDFATPVKYIESYVEGGDVKVVVSMLKGYDHMAYQSNNMFTLEVLPLQQRGDALLQSRNSSAYIGDKLSLNFQNIEVRAVLQLIADFIDLNMVVSDTVVGNVTLRLDNVPWDQALDIILQTRGLDKRQIGNVMLVAPSEEISAREKQEFEAMQQLGDLMPTVTALVQVNYAKAENIAALLKGKQNSMLSGRGNVTVDERTNSLLINDTADKIEAIKLLIVKLDIPIRQVQIEARIVIANDDFSKELGVRAGLSEQSAVNLNTGVSFLSNGSGVLTGSLDDAHNIFDGDLRTLNQSLNVNLPVVGQAGRFAYSVLGADYLLDLELSAMQAEGRGEVVSSPRVVTSDQSEALIEQGVEIPYQQSSSSGASTVAFKKAVLSLSVVPQITPDDRVIMDLEINKDSESPRQVLGVPSIDTRHISTQVLVRDGDTVVLGGIYEQLVSEGVEKIPFFGDLPLVGIFFRHTTKKDRKAELLIFVTPKILKDDLTSIRQ